MRVSPADGIEFATSAAIADVNRWRTLIDDDATGESFAKALAALVKTTKADVVGDDLKKVPKPFDPDHPRADLLRHKGFRARWIEQTPKKITSAGFAGWGVDRLVKTADVHAWLVAHLT